MTVGDSEGLSLRLCQGIGFLLFNAVNGKDYPLMQSCFLVITIAVLAANIMADFIYAILDPRTRQEG